MSKQQASVDVLEGKPTFKIGDKVKMINCLEADVHKDSVWTCRTDSYIPKNYPNDEVVFLENFAGWFLCEYLERVQ